MSTTPEEQPIEAEPEELGEELDPDDEETPVEGEAGASVEDFHPDDPDAEAIIDEE